MKHKITYKKQTELNFKGGELFQRMNYLLKLGSDLYNKHPNMAKVYSHMAKDISKRNAIRIDSKVKKLICEKCGNLLFIDKNTYLEVKNKAGKMCLNLNCDKCQNNVEIILF
jgi:RNase P subunit RPR2